MNLVTQMFSRNNEVNRAESAVDKVARRVIRRSRFSGVNRDRREVTHIRGFDAAATTDAFADWTTTDGNINALMSSKMDLMRKRCRSAMRNNDYAKHAGHMFSKNIVGDKGVRLSALCRNPAGDVDDQTTIAIEAAWNNWAGYKKHCDMSERKNWRDQLAFIMKQLVMDGEIFLQLVEGSNAGKYGFRLYYVDPQKIDHKLNQKAKNGNEIINGVEVDEWLKPVAYYGFASETGLNAHVFDNGTRYVRYEADKLIHFFLSEFPDQVRGISPLAVCLGSLHLLNTYEEAAVLNAKYGASKPGFYTNDGSNPIPAFEEDEEGELVDNVGPGQLGILPPGWNFTPFESAYPSGEMKDFNKTILRAMAGGLGVDYTTFANDLESTNNASSRIGINETQAMWRGIQQAIIDNIVTPIYEAWLKQAILRKQITVHGKPLSLTSENRYQDVKWMPHRWLWPDPAKDAKYAKFMIDYRLKSPSEVAGEIGLDFEQSVIQCAKDEALMQKHNIKRLPSTITDDSSEIEENYNEDEKGNLIHVDNQ